VANLNGVEEEEEEEEIELTEKTHRVESV